MTSDDFDPINEAAYDAFKNADSAEEALQVVAFLAGETWEKAIENFASNLLVSTARSALAAILQSMVDKKQTETVLALMLELTRLDLEARGKG